MKEKLLQFLKDKGVVGNKKNRKFCWKKYFDEECQQRFSEYSKNYRTEAEAWFCLTHDCEPPICGVCGKELCEFTGRKKSIIPGYCQICKNCSPNQLPHKIKVISEKWKNHTSEQREEIKRKIRKTRKERYGDENYGLYGSKSFKENMFNKYGDEYYSNHEQARKTCLEKYGVECNLQLLDSSKIWKEKWENNYDDELNKRKQTCLNRYGAEYFFQSEKFKELYEKTILEKYNSLNEFYKYKIDKCKETKLKKYGDENYHNIKKIKKTIKLNHSEFEEKYNCTHKQKILKKYGQGWKSLNLPEITNNRYKYISNEYLDIIKQYSEEIHNVKTISKKEIELKTFIDKLLNNKYELLFNKKINDENNKKYELDIFIPELNIAFEFNGDYWHSDKFKDKYYHQIKTKLCYLNNIMLIHIYEYQWDNNKNKIKTYIKNLLNGYEYPEKNWVKPENYNKYSLSEPNLIILNEGTNKEYKIYDEGKFILKS